MPIDPNVLDARNFDADAARDASLLATLSRVRLRRRVRRSGSASVALLAVASVVWAAMPAPESKPGRLADNPLVVRSVSLTAEQRVFTATKRDLFIHTPAEPVAAVRFTTPSDAVVPRLGEAEFHRWLAAHEVYCIQLGGELPQVLPLRPD
jgi:hypothetical protein